MSGATLSQGVGSIGGVLMLLQDIYPAFRELTHAILRVKLILCQLIERRHMRERPGCLVGLLKLFLLDKLFDWLQQRFGFGRGFSCAGLGCGILLLIVFIALACSIFTGTDWLRLF